MTNDHLYHCIVAGSKTLEACGACYREKTAPRDILSAAWLKRFPSRFLCKQVNMRPMDLAKIGKNTYEGNA
jgi:hypothetical protein